MRLKIADLKDRRLADSLYRYFDDADERYRADAAEAFGSLQDTTAIDRLGQLLLNERSAAVRKAAAFALGQTNHSASAKILFEALSQERDPGVIAEILKAYGKTTTAWRLSPGPFLSDSITLAGFAWSLYQAGLRGKADSANAIAAALLDQRYSQNTRLAAAHFFARGSSDPHKAETALIRSAITDNSNDVRMAAVTALGKAASDSCLSTLKSIIQNEQDSRVVVNAVRALGSFPYRRIKNYLYDAVTGKDINAGIAASEILLSSIQDDDWIKVSSLTTRIHNWRILANVYEAALKVGMNPDLEKEIEGECEKASAPYQKAAFLACLKHDPAAFNFIESQLRQTDTAIVRSAAANTLAAMSRLDNIPPSLRPRFAATFADLMQSEDPAVVGIVASALAFPGSGYKMLIKNHDFLYKARERLRLPRDVEALQAIEEAIAYFEDREPSPVKNAFNHPVNWQLAKSIQAGQRAVIKTPRGNIVIRLLVEEAPGSVANFVALAKKNYFDNKFFHRVVPNFVVQAGCPRGDGWGSEDYSIRSEFSPRPYKTGSVGMASAGKDTECTQWFITYSPTPHLNGRYTIFGEVVDGFAVMNYLQLGDKILGVEIERSEAQ